MAEYEDRKIDTLSFRTASKDSGKITEFLMSAVNQDCVVNSRAMTKTKYSVPWIDATIKRLVKKRHKLYLRARKSKDPDVKIHYMRFRAHVLRDAYWKYVSNIFMFENDSSDPDTPKPKD